MGDMGKMEENESYGEFMTRMLKKCGKKNFKIKGSWGVYEAYKHIRKNGWYDIGKPVKESEFYHIVRGINRILADKLAEGESVRLPCGMGQLELRKREPGASIVNGRLKVTYPVDWHETMKLWYEDEEARKKKILIRRKAGDVYSVKYNKWKATYDNKSFYEFVLNRFIKKALKENINNNKVNVLW